MLQMIIASLVTLLPGTHSADIIPLYLVENKTRTVWQVPLNQYTLNTDLSDFKVLVSLPDGDKTDYTITLKRKRAILLHKTIRAEMHKAKPVALSIGRILTMADNNLTLTIHAETSPVHDRIISPSALLIPKNDPLFDQADVKPSTLLNIQFPDKKFHTYVQEFRLGTTGIYGGLIGLPLIFVAYIRFLFFRRRHFRQN